jgi:signal transduction histidine kinase
MASNESRGVERQERWRARRELLAVVMAALATYGLAGAIELRERLQGWLAPFERWELDELPFALFVLASGMAWHALRRSREARLALARRIAAEQHASELLTHNRALSRGLIHLQEKERVALARELHDEVGQYCTALRMETAFLRRCGPDESAARLAASARADAAAQSIGEVVRGLLHRLRPAQLDTLGLVPALQALCEGWELRSGIACVFHPEATADPIDEATAIAVYRVAQEALTNVMRHAGASTVRVALRSAAPGTLRLAVQDDGVGIDPARPRHGLGLLGASERAASLGGRLDVRAAPGGGLVVELDLPLRAALAEAA